MKFWSSSFLAGCCVLIVASGCGHEPSAQDFLSQGDAAQKNEEYDDAIEDYTSAIELNPGFAEAYVQRGNVLTEIGEFDRAVADFDAALRLDPQDVLAHELRGNAYFGALDIEAAMNDYDLVIRMQPDNVRVLKMRGRAYYWQGDYADAVVDLTKALKSVTNDPEIYDDRGGAFFSEKETDPALGDYSAAIRLDSEDATALFGRARIFDMESRYAEAASDLRRLVKLKPRAEEACNFLAWLLATCPDDQIRNGNTAVEWAAKACSLSKWKDFACVDTLAAAYAETGDFEHAVRYQKQAANMDDIPGDVLTNIQNRLELYLQGKPYRETNSADD